MMARLLVHTTGFVALLGALLFVGAGTWHWPQAWIYLLLNLAGSLGIGLWLAQHDPDLLRQRMSLTHADQARWDRLFLGGIGALFMLWFVVMGWQRRVDGAIASTGVEVLGAVLVALSFAMVAWTFATNSFAVPQVRVQTDRAQTVIDTGPYAIVRHPMYTGAIVFFIGPPLLLGTWWGLLFVPLFTAGLVWRILGEEATLRRQLPGYRAYANKVTFRLLPGIW